MDGAVAQNLPNRQQNRNAVLADIKPEHRLVRITVRVGMMVRMEAVRKQPKEHWNKHAVPADIKPERQPVLQMADHGAIVAGVHVMKQPKKQYLNRRVVL